MAHPHAAHGHHITPMKTLLGVISALVFLTLITVFTSRIDLGAFNVPLALAIAITKATLVVMIFMGLKYDNKVNTLVLSIGSVFVVVFLTFTLFDTAFRGDLSNVSPTTIADDERRAQALQAASSTGAAATDTTAAADTSAAAPATADTTATAPAATH
jgi:cytochrome c oxidase subunit 4